MIKFISVIYLFLLLLVSCASPVRNALKFQDGTVAKTYVYRDVSGEFECAREIRKNKSKLASRTRLLSSAGRGEKLVEKTFALSEVGTIKTKSGRAIAIRPSLSQHTVWLEGKKYFSQLKLLPKEHKMSVIMQSPEEKWSGNKVLKLPRGRVFCFFSQLPECLLLSGFIEGIESGKTPRPKFFVVWDSYPYHQEHYNGLSESAFSLARVVLEKRNKSSTFFNVELADQVIGLHFSKAGEFIRMFWTSQGVSMIPPSEANDSAEKL